MDKIYNIDKAALRIHQAIRSNERIVLYGDSDLDGVTSILIAESAIKSFGGSISALYFPERDKEGYGITEKALGILKEHAPGLLVTYDLGISNFKEVDMANDLGFEVVIVDHHLVLDHLPNASVIVDPKQSGDEYPFKEFAACGLSLKLAEELFGGTIPFELRKSMVELAALGTIADMMQRTDDNALIIAEGLMHLQDSWRPGIRAFLDQPEFQAFDHIQLKAEQMISVLNIREVVDGLPAAFRLLSCTDPEEASRMVEDFMEKNRIRKERIRDAAEDVRQRASFHNEDPIVFDGNPDFEFMLLGAVASIIEHEFHKPTFIYSQGSESSIGSVRAPHGMNTVDAMKSCADILLTYGGHPQASGFRIKNEHLEEFRERLIRHFLTTK